MRPALRQLLLGNSPRLFQVTQRGRFPQSSVTVPNAPGTTYRQKLIVPGAFSSPRLYFANAHSNDSSWPTSAVGDGATGLNSITFRCAIESPAGVFTPVYFSGQRDVTLAAGAVIWSDPVPLSVAAAQAFFVRTYITVAALGKEPLVFLTDQTGEGADTSGSDVTTAGGTFSGVVQAFGVSAVLGLSGPTAKPGILLVGDSIMDGTNDGGGFATGNTTGGFMQRALAGTFPYLKISQPTERAEWFTTTRAYLRTQLLGSARYAVCNFGINDKNNGATLASLQASATAVWNLLAQAGCRVYACTLTPNTTSTDSWATTANQTVTTGETVRTGYNDWLRTLPSPLSGYFETADAVESARNSGKWAVDGTANKYTADGLHPSSFAAAALAAAVNTAPFV